MVIRLLEVFTAVSYTHLDVYKRQIYDNQFEQAEELLKRQSSDCQPRLILNVPDGTNFFDIKPEDFELVDYEPVKPQLKFDLAI